MLKKYLDNNDDNVQKNENFNSDKKNINNNVLIIGFILFLILGIVAFSFGKIASSIIAVIAILFLILSFIIKKLLVKKYISIIMLIMAFILIIPYFYLFKTSNENYNQYEWNGIFLLNIIEKPKSHYGRIISNSNKYLSLDVNKTSKLEYENYIKNIIDKGFIYDIKQTNNSFYSHNKSGYKLSINYYESKEKMNIQIDAPIFKWSNSDLAKLVPTPKSIIGKIEKDDKVGFIAYVGNIKKEEYSSYVSLCSNNGFNINASNTGTRYFALDSESNKIIVEYYEDNTMKIEVYYAEYDIGLFVDYVEHSLFSKYDVKIFVDDSYKGIVSYGKKVEYKETLSKGNHKIKFVNSENEGIVREEILNVSKDESVEYKLSCTSSQIEIDVTKPTVKSIKITSPASGEYDGGKEINIRVQFSENIKGIAPILKLKIGNKIVTALATNPMGEYDYIDYSYKTDNSEYGKIEIESYSGEGLTDIVGNNADIIKLENTGYQITIKVPEANRALFAQRSFTTSGNKTIEYWIYVPDISIVKTYKNIPLVVALHMNGINSMSSLSSYSIMQYIKNKEIQPNAIVVAPLTYNGGKQINEYDTTSIIELISDIKRSYDINANKISIAGHSQGARNALRIAKANPNYFSACVLFSWVESGASGTRHDMQTKPMPTCNTKFVYESSRSANYNRNIAVNLSNTYPNIFVETVPNTSHGDVIIAYKTTNILQWMIEQTK